MEKKTQIAMTLKRSMRHSEIPGCSMTANVQAICLHFCKWKRYSFSHCEWCDVIRLRLHKLHQHCRTTESPSLIQNGLGYGGKYRPNNARTSTHTPTFFVWVYCICLSLLGVADVFVITCKFQAICIAFQLQCQQNLKQNKHPSKRNWTQIWE